MENSCGYPCISLTNVTENEIFTFSLILVKGFVNTSSGSIKSNSLVVFAANDDQLVKQGNYRIRNNRFSVLLDLKLGENEFVFRVLENEVKKTFFFVPPDKVFVVTPVYIVCDDNNENNCDNVDTTPTPEENDVVQTVCNRIVTGCRLIQALIAETLFQCGFPKRTFFMENAVDHNENSGCLVFKSSLTADVSSSMNAEELWAYFGRELMTSKYGSKNRKFLAFFSNRKRTRAKPLAVGGGGLALCGTEYLKTWPTSVDDLKAWFVDYSYTESGFSSRDMNENVSPFDASVGAVCHELCHTFDLGHTKSGMMGTDFHDIGLILVAADDENAFSTKIVRTRNLNEFKNNCNWNVDKSSAKTESNMQYSTRYDTMDFKIEEFYKIDNHTRSINEQFSGLFVWNLGCASLLAYHRWINNVVWNTTKYDQVNEDPIRYDYTRGVITSKNAIVVVQLRLRCGLITKYWEFPAEQNKIFFLIPIYEVRRATMLLIEDKNGYLFKKKLNHFKFPH